MKIDALLDSNVVIASLVAAHEYHVPSAALFMDDGRKQFAVAAHSYAEAYSTLTRQGERAPFRFSSDEAWAALERIRGATILLGLTPSQTFDTIRSYAKTRGIGRRLYDRLIGEVAVMENVETLVTWNIGHMKALFPDLTVATPTQFVGN